MDLVAGYVGAAVRYLEDNGQSGKIFDSTSVIIAHHLEEAQAICRKLATEPHYKYDVPVWSHSDNIKLAEKLSKLAANFSGARTHKEHDSARKALKEFAETEIMLHYSPIKSALIEALRANEHGPRTALDPISYILRNRGIHGGSLYRL